MILNKLVAALLLIAGMILAGCGGGGGGIAYSGNGGGSSGGIGGTGVTSTGTIDGFGSIFVNGVEFETDESEIVLDGVPSTDGELRLGMVVTVSGILNEDGKTGSANLVTFHNELVGPISSIEIFPDNDALALTVLGVRIIAERAATVFDGVSFATLAAGDLIEVSGFFESNAQIRATRIEKNATFVAGVSTVKLEGKVSALSDNQFSLGTVVVDYSNAELSDIPQDRITEGLLVEVYGTLTGNVITANLVEKDEDISHGLDGNSEVSVLGAITDFIDLSHFSVNKVAVDASSAELEPRELALANGLIVEVEGIWDGSKLQAKAVKSRRGQVKLAARIASVDTTGKSITVQYATGTVTVMINNKTLLTDDTASSNPLSLGNIGSGDFLQIEASQVGDVLLASRIQRNEADDDFLRAPVERFTAGVDITLLGMTFSTAGAAFENSERTVISADAFYSQLDVGDLVTISDEEAPDGIAEAVEFKHK